MTRIVHLSSAHEASDTRIFHKECRSLAAAGFDVTLIANADRDSTNDGVRIIGLTRRSGNRFIRMTRTVFEVYQLARREHGDAYHFHDPELIPVGLLLKLSGKHVVYDSHEHVSKQIRSKHWIPEPLRAPVASIYRLLERGSSRLFDGVVAATPGIADAFPGDGTVVVQNFAMAAEFESGAPVAYRQRPCQLAYVGGITEARGAIEMIKALALVDGEATLALAGTFTPPALQQELEALPGWRRVRALGWLQRQEVVDVLHGNRVGLLVLHPEPNYLDSWPVKLFEYMLAGLPVIASDFPFWRKLISEPNAGILVNPLDPQAIADAISWLMDHPDEAEAMGQRGRQAALARYSWDHEAARLVEFYRTKVFG